MKAAFLALSLFAMVAHRALAADVPIALSVDQRTFQETLAGINAKAGPAVKQKFGRDKGFLATGDWQKEYTPTSPGGSFYHPDIPDIDYKNRWGVHIAGWVARWPGFDTDSIAFVLCHELGHHLYGGGGEVEADHFAPTCLRWVWSAADNGTWLSRKQASLSDEAKAMCAQSETPQESEFCLRTATSYLSVESFRAAIWKKNKILNDGEIAEANACRRTAVQRGIQGLSAPSCQH